MNVIDELATLRRVEGKEPVPRPFVHLVLDIEGLLHWNRSAQI